MEHAVLPHHFFTRGTWPLGGRLVGQTPPLGIRDRIENRGRSRPCGALPGSACHHRLRRTLRAAKLGVAQPNTESRDAARQHEWRGRRSARRFLPQFGAGLRQTKNSQQVLHGVRFLQALSSRYLQPVVQFGPPFFFIQQPVVPQVDRIHAGHRRHQAFQVVRGMSRSGSVVCRPDGYAHQADCASTRSAGRSGLHDVSFHRACEKHHGPGRLLPGVSQAT